MLRVGSLYCDRSSTQSRNISANLLRKGEVGHCLDAERRAGNYATSQEQGSDRCYHILVLGDYLGTAYLSIMPECHSKPPAANRDT